MIDFELVGSQTDLALDRIRFIKSRSRAFAKEYAITHKGESFDFKEFPKGFVVDGELEEEIWGSINPYTYAIPLTPGGQKKNSGIGTLNILNKTYGNGRMFFVQDQRNSYGMSTSYVLCDDLNRNPIILINEALVERMKGNDTLAEIKIHAWMMITGKDRLK